MRFEGAVYAFVIGNHAVGGGRAQGLQGLPAECVIVGAVGRCGGFALRVADAARLPFFEHGLQRVHAVERARKAGVGGLVGEDFLNLVHRQPLLQTAFDGGFQTAAITCSRQGGNRHDGELFGGKRRGLPVFCHIGRGGTRQLYALQPSGFVVGCLRADGDMTHGGVFARAVPMFDIGRTPHHVAFFDDLNRFAPFLRAPFAFGND